MKVFCIINGQCSWDVTREADSVEKAKALYSWDGEFVETPDWVFPGCTYNPSEIGDGRFALPPTLVTDIYPFPYESGIFNPPVEDLPEPEPYISAKEMLDAIRIGIDRV